MPAKRPVPPFNWKRSLVIVLIADVVFLVGLLVSLVLLVPELRQASVGGLAVGVIGAIAIGIFGPLFTRPRFDDQPRG
jgi:hypothetical protein